MIYWKALVIVIPFSFRGITHTCLLQITIKHNKSESLYQIYLLIAYPQDQLIDG